MKRSKNVLLFLLGFTLWLPGISVFNISGSWGIQICQVVILLLLALAALSFKTFFSVKQMHKATCFYAVFFLASITSVFFSTLGVERSFLTFSSEMVGVIFSVVSMLFICKSRENLLRFFSGYKVSGLMSSIYAVYQLVGLKSGMVLAFPLLNNPSFSSLDLDSAALHGRAFAFTPEPSVLASLLMPLIGIGMSDFLMFKRVKYLISLLIYFTAFLATSSQSVVALPFYLAAIILYARKTTVNIINIRLSKVFFLILSALLSIVLIFYFSESAATSFNRVLDLENNGSAAARGNDIFLGFNMFLSNPLSGWGLGSFSSRIEGFQEITGASSGLVRLLGEQGGLGIIVIISGLVLAFPRKIFGNIQPSSLSHASILVYLVALILGFLISIVCFVGYRNLYHLWLIFPLMFSLNLLIAEGQSSDKMLKNPLRSHADYLR
jgi:O-antigen ligase